VIVLSVSLERKMTCFERHYIRVRRQVDKNQTLFCNLNVHREEAVCLLVKFAYDIKGRGLLWSTQLQ